MSDTTSAPVVTATPSGTPEPVAAPKTDVDAVTPVAAAPVKRKIKVYGQEEEYTDDELVQLAQKGRGADKKFAELSEKEKKIQSALGKTKDKPWEALKELGADADGVRQILVQELLKEFEDAQLKEKDPNAYEKSQLQKERDELRQKNQKYEKDLETQKIDEQNAQILAETEDTFGAALDKLGERSPKLIVQMIDLELAALRAGRTLNADELAAHIRASHDASHKESVEKEYGKLKTLQGEDLISALPPEIVKAVQGALLARARAKIGPRGSQAAQQAVREAEETPAPKRGYESDSAILKRIMRD